MGMSYDRKKVVAKIFNHHQLEEGSISKRELLREFTPKSHPAVIEGSISSSQALNNLESCISSNAVTWIEFLDYFKHLSPAIADDLVFEDVARQIFHTSTGKTRRVLITYYDGTQQVAELDDVITSGLNMQAIYSKLNELGYFDIADVKL
jgi:hypothetical protein